MSEEPREPSAPKGISRREFARRAAVASAVAAVAPASALTSPSSPLNEHATVAATDRGGRFSDPSTNVVSSAEQQPTNLPKLSP